MVFFEPSRADGRSDRQVVYDLVTTEPPGTVFSYAELHDALNTGLGKKVKRERVYGAIANTNQKLLKDDQRYLVNVENVGYRMIRADEHVPVSVAKRDRARNNLKRGVELLRHARLDELSEAQRILHEGQLMILSSIHDAVQESARRHDRAEAIIEHLLKRQEEQEHRLERLENLSIEDKDVS